MIKKNYMNAPTLRISSNENTTKPTKFANKCITLTEDGFDLTNIKKRHIGKLPFHLGNANSYFSYEITKYNETMCEKELQLMKNIELLASSKIPDSWERITTDSFRKITDREGNTYCSYIEIIQRKFRMYGLVDNTWVSELATELKQLGVKSCLEIGGGYGWLSLALSRHFKVKCTDKNPEQRDHEPTPIMSGFPVEKMDAASTAKNYGSSHDAVVVSWPHYPDEWVKNLEHDKIIVYIGESPFDGQMAGIEFFKYFNMKKCIHVPGGSQLGCIIGTKTNVETDQFDMDTLYTKDHVYKEINLPKNWV